MRSLFVVVHKARIADHVRGQNRRQPALDPDWPLLHHGRQTFRDAICTIKSAAALRPAQRARTSSEFDSLAAVEPRAGGQAKA